MTYPTTTSLAGRTLYECPHEGCEVFPFFTEAEVDEHVAAGVHVLPASEVPEAHTGSIDTHVVRPVQRESSGLAGASPAPRANTDRASKIAGLVEANGFNPTLDGVAVLAWSAAYTGDFGFMCDMAKKAAQDPNWLPTAAQFGAIVRCKNRADAAAAPKTAKAAEVAAAPDPKIAEGRYAIAGADGVLRFYKLDAPTEGKWAGYTFLKVQAGDNYHPVKGGLRKAIMLQIAADPKEAMLAYGRALGHCGHCGRTLTDEQSRRDGIGPVCRKGLGW